MKPSEKEEWRERHRKPNFIWGRTETAPHYTALETHQEPRGRHQRTNTREKNDTPLNFNHPRHNAKKSWNPSSLKSSQRNQLKQQDKPTTNRYISLLTRSRKSNQQNSMGPPETTEESTCGIETKAQQQEGIDTL